MEVHTVDTFAKTQKLSRQSALNKLSHLKKKGLVTVKGGGSQKRLYTITKKPVPVANGFYTVVNKHAPEKLVPQFIHQVFGNYTVEHAIIDGIQLGDARTLEATKHLFNQVKNWKRLFDLAKKHDVTAVVQALYEEAQQEMKVRKLPRRYQ